ncbi:thioredoxin family protein [Caldisalinibacter kiritimatiensis]|uniref:Thioredoxin domain-containing protein n=1 Tax=Caldisalinibacter kiritimatiensis TaxID=1304284 RepID=R1AU18_9FIRM|nr:thioredoxin domain-containing protein [Caldisalinibacter kiritimatiensis]EOD00648.1 hypothetical protein L21TH_1249 [Caldisalinibacter kiritimatiensis]
MSERLSEISIESIEKQVFDSDKIVILLFCSENWNPCFDLEKTLINIKHTYKANVDVYKVDYNKNKKLAKNFEIISLPTMVFFYKGNEVKRFTGSMDKELLKLNIMIIIKNCC